METIIKFRGIDKFNRAVYKVVDKAIYFGSTDTLFNSDVDAIEVNNYFNSNLDELEYFGRSFGCEPCGGKNDNLLFKII